MSTISEEYYVKRSGMAQFLEKIGENPGSSPLSVYMPPGISSDDVESLIVPELPEEVGKKMLASPTGSALFFAETNYLVLPPFPVNEKVVFPEIEAEPILSLLNTDFVIGLVLVHLGSYAVGVCRGENLISSKVGTGLVHGRTKKGGSSSARYQRRRKNQTREFLEKVCLRTQEYLEPYGKSMDYILYGGPRVTIERLQKICPFLQSLNTSRLSLMEVPPLKQRVLEASVRRLWSSCIFRWREE